MMEDAKTTKKLKLKISNMSSSLVEVMDDGTEVPIEFSENFFTDETELIDPFPLPENWPTFWKDL